jgi:hypothetical protein
VALLGDFRREPPTPAQRAILPCVCAALLAQLGRDVDALHGHDELQGGSRDPDKECPGRHLSIDALRDAVRGLSLEPQPWPRFAWT